MNRKYSICLLVILLVCLVGRCAAASDQEQWLGYRSSAEAARIVGKTPGQYLELTSERPQGVSLPQLAAEDTLFGKWKTPMVPAGFVWLVLDRSGKTGPYDQLYIDSDADDSLADEAPVRSRSLVGRLSGFRQVKVLLNGEGGPTAFHLNLDLHAPRNKTRRLLVTAGGWYEGDVKIEGVKHHLRLFDANANGAFDDAYLDFSQSDLIKITTAARLNVGRVGKYIQIGDKFHKLEVARDGAFVQFSDPKDLDMGTVRLSEGLSLLSAGGTNGLFFVPVEDGQVKLPLGKYRVNHWELERKDKAGSSWKLVASAPTDQIVFKVGKGPPPEVDLGEPLTASASVQQRGSIHRFSNPTLSGRHGERIAVTRDGRRPPAPKLLIRNADGSYNRRFSFAYG